WAPSSAAPSRRAVISTSGSSGTRTAYEGRRGWLTRRATPSRPADRFELARAQEHDQLGAGAVDAHGSHAALLEVDPPAGQRAAGGDGLALPARREPAFGIGPGVVRLGLPVPEKPQLLGHGGNLASAGALPVTRALTPDGEVEGLSRREVADAVRERERDAV